MAQAQPLESVAGPPITLDPACLDPHAHACPRVPCDSHAASTVAGGCPVQKAGGVSLLGWTEGPSGRRHSLLQQTASRDDPGRPGTYGRWAPPPNPPQGASAGRSLGPWRSRPGTRRSGPLGPGPRRPPGSGSSQSRSYSARCCSPAAAGAVSPAPAPAGHDDGRTAPTIARSPRTRPA